MSDLNIKGDGFYLNANKRKDKDTHPDFVGYLKLTPQQLAGLIDIYERSRANNEDPVLQIDLAAWKRRKDDGEVFLYASNEIYTGGRKKSGGNGGGGYGGGNRGYSNNGGGYGNRGGSAPKQEIDEEIPF